MSAEKIRANTVIKAVDPEPIVVVVVVVGAAVVEVVGTAVVVVVVATTGVVLPVIVITDKELSLTAAVVMSDWMAVTNVGSRMSSRTVFISVASVVVIWTRISPVCR
jgi:hypothetical protein